MENPKLDRLNNTNIALNSLNNNPSLFNFEEALNKGFEQSYCDRVSHNHRRKHGQFFTPKHIANLMADWVMEVRPNNVLDPAVGTGVLLNAIADICQNTNLIGYDIDALCLDYANARLAKYRHELFEGDFLTENIERKFDAIIANPPYLRHHDLDYKFDIFAEFSKIYDLQLSRLSNAYLLFLIKSLHLLKPNGRASFIIPAEWSNSNFGSALKKLCKSKNTLRHIIYFNHNGIVFDDNLSTGCILLFENTPSIEFLNTHYVPANLKAHTLDQLKNDPRNFQSQYCITKLETIKKWDYVVSKGLQEELKGFVALKELATTKRGIATGANSYFHVDIDTIHKYDISEKHYKRCIGKARSASSFTFTEEDWNRNVKFGQPSYLLDFSDQLSESEQEYINYGIQEKINERYLTKARKKWFFMEKQKIAPIFAAVFGREAMRFIVNKAGINTLTTFHCVYPFLTESSYIKALAICLNSKFIQERARAKSRVYGNGLVKFEPKDLLEIEVPDLRFISQKSIEKLAQNFDFLDKTHRSKNYEFNWDALDALVLEVSKEAAANL